MTQPSPTAARERHGAYYLDEQISELARRGNGEVRAKRYIASAKPPEPHRARNLALLALACAFTMGTVWRLMDWLSR